MVFAPFFIVSVVVTLVWLMRVSLIANEAWTNVIKFLKFWLVVFMTFALIVLDIQFADFLSFGVFVVLFVVLSSNINNINLRFIFQVKASSFYGFDFHCFSEMLVIFWGLPDFISNLLSFRSAASRTNFFSCFYDLCANFFGSYWAKSESNFFANFFGSYWAASESNYLASIQSNLFFDFDTWFLKTKFLFYKLMCTIF